MSETGFNLENSYSWQSLEKCFTWFVWRGNELEEKDMIFQRYQTAKKMGSILHAICKLYLNIHFKFEQHRIHSVNNNSISMTIAAGG